MFKLDVNKEDIARYLGYKGKVLDEEIEKAVDLAVVQLREIATPKVIYRLFALKKKEEQIEVEGTTLVLEGQSIRRLLKACDQCFLLAVTLGQAVDERIRCGQVQRENLSQSVILDVCASSMVEEICNQVNEKLEKEWLAKGSYLTDRFSPGYGDLPLEVQQPFCQVLDTPRQIGLQVMRSGLMVPSKSITAIIGIANERQEKVFRGCKNCVKKKDCTYGCSNKQMTREG